MEQNKPKHLLVVAIVLNIVLIAFILLGILSSKRLKISIYTLKDTIPSQFSIIQISDFHYPKNNVKTEKMLKEIEDAKPDFVAFTGDIIDGSASLEDMRFVCQNLAKIAALCPTFYVLGNHEIGHTNLAEYMAMLEERGLVLLNNKLKIYDIRQSKIAFIGLTDGKMLSVDNVPALPNKSLCHYSVLLAHRPELFENYCKSQVNLALTGHTHGGQARLFKQGLFAPNQGFFPKYSHGKYQKDNTTMLVNSGLSGVGRFFNPYEINKIIITP